jgi:hypothetical protein
MTCTSDFPHTLIVLHPSLSPILCSYGLLFIDIYDFSKHRRVGIFPLLRYLPLIYPIVRTSVLHVRSDFVLAAANFEQFF